MPEQAMPMTPQRFMKALRQGVFENNRRLARALAEWGGPLEEGQVREILHRWAFGTPRPTGLGAPEPLPVRRPVWRNLPQHRRVAYGSLLSEIRERWVARLTREIQTMARDHKATLARYAERPDTQGGRIVSGDTLLHLIPGVAENPPLALAAFQDVDPSALGELASLGTRIRDHVLDLAGREPVILMAGGEASGKSTLSCQLIRQGFPGAIVDSPWVSEKDVQKVLDRGYEAWVVYLDRTFEDAFQSMLLRAADEGRIVDPDESARTHTEVPPMLLRSLAPFRDQPRVSCWHLRNTASNLDLAEAIGGPLDGDGKDALASIRMRPESRSRADFQQAARKTWARFQHAIQARRHNPYPADLTEEISRRMPSRY
ncbi:hypothetical protein [Holophaga foetida]|uniref:hypothetical protein n=1 Tax=Holophaga foetida TaxID=35839 RepID=UPI00024717FD|nr:hypothetical protein [Holophaga foetida]